MKTFYSILSAVINPLTNEKVSMGLLLSNGKDSFFEISVNRLSVVKSLISKDQYKFIKDYLKSIYRVIQKIDRSFQDDVIIPENGNNIIVNESYMEYLSRYSQNITVFSKPVQIEVELNKGIFQKLFNKYIETDTIVVEKEQRSIYKIKDSFLPKVEQYFSIEKEISSVQFPSLVMPITIDIFGKNEIPVFGQFIDLERAVNHIKNDYFDIMQLSEVIPNSVKFLISCEPDKHKFIQQHNIWDQLRNDKSYSYTDISEVESIEAYAQKHGVIPV